jgi:hypothetical protein
MKKIIFLGIWILIIASKCDNDNMITTEINSELDSIKSKGTQLPANIHSDFDKYSRKHGLDAEFSVYNDLTKSRSAILLENGDTKRVPTISIYLKTTQNFIDNGIDKHDHNWSSDYKNTKDLISYWNELLVKYGYSEKYHSDNMLIFIYSLEELITSKIVSHSKQQIIDWIDQVGFSPKPEYVFSSSEPCYNIVFVNKADYDIFLKEKESNLSSMIYKTLEANDDFNYFKKQSVKINYLHKDMEGINLYGLSRQD